MKRNLISYMGPSLGFFLFLLALWVLHRELREIDYHTIVNDLGAVAPAILVKALLLTALNYFVLTGYDTLAIKYIGKQLSYAKLAFASFIGYGFSNALGFGMIAGGTVRLRLYSSWGLGASDIFKVISFCTVTLWLGLFTTGGVWFLFEPASLLSRGALSVTMIRLVGILLICTAGGYLLLCTLRKEPFIVRNWQISPPSSSLAISQILISSLDWALAGSVLYVLLPFGSDIDYVQFFGIFLLAQVAGVVSQVPGGLGIFESVIVLLLSPPIPGSKVITALLLYRTIYYILPLAVAAVMLAVHEAIDRWAKIKGLTRAISRWIPQIAPWLLIVATFLGGIVLMISGATPSVPARIAWLRVFVPLPLLEVSHFLSTLVGATLLIVARGLQRRLDGAYHVTVALLIGGILFSLLKGFDYEEAGALAAVLVLLIPSRHYFYRKASLLVSRFSPGWMVAVVLVLAGSIWLVMFSYKHVTYSNDLLWQFTFAADAPRSLRGLVGAVSALVILGVYQLFRAAPPDLSPPGTGELDKARDIILLSRDTSAYLALLGDKNLLFSETNKSFVMYAVEGRSWVAMGDPVGPMSEVADLLWCFREMCDKYDGWPVFYEAGSKHLPLYLDLGLMPLKIGEEARVSLPEFTTDGGKLKRLRNVVHKFEREKNVFTIVPSSDVPPLLSELRSVSDAWLKEKHTREKGFSLGFFNEAYLARFPIALVRNDGRITAFANIWQGAEKEELSTDLMRHLPDAPPGVMEYLFIRLMEWGKQQDYRWLNLGMVPLSGLESHSLSPLWNKLGAKVYRNGEYFYNFQGLRHYKEQFNPVWEPRYLVSPGGFRLPHILANVASLISGGLKGVITR